MSHFLCGEFVFRGRLPAEGRAEGGFSLVEAALRNRLALQLGCNIVQDTVFEILKVERASPDAGRLPFLMTDSPLSDSSDDLISPYALEGPYLPRLEQNLRRVGRFLQSVAETGEVSAAIIFFSEGYDEEYREVAIPVERFTEECLEFFREEEQVPSLKVVINF